MSNHLNRHSQLHTLLERLNLGGMAERFADLALKAAKENLSHEAYLYELARHEEELRTQRRTVRLLRASGLPQEKTFRRLDLSRLSTHLQVQIERLKTGAFLETSTNVIAVPFMALFKRDRLPSRSALSRFLAALTEEPIEALRTLFLDDLLARPLTPDTIPQPNVEH